MKSLEDRGNIELMNKIYNLMIKMPIEINPNLISYLIESNCRVSNECEVFEMIVEVNLY